MTHVEERDAGDDEDRHENRGRNSRKEPNWVKREHFFALIAALTVGGGGGGYLGVGSISSRLDDQRVSAAASAKEQNEKLDKLVLAFTKLEAIVAAGEKTGVKVDAELLAHGGRIAGTEQKLAGHDVKLEEHDRRLSALEGKK